MSDSKKTTSETITASEALTPVRLRERVAYCPESGEFTWIAGIRIGKPAASVHGCGYRTVRIDGRSYLLHRLAWLYVHGRWPINQIDHINGERADNRIANLRECTNSQNCQNVRPHKDGSGLLGTSFIKALKKWQAGIGTAGKRRHLGYFQTQDEAHSAYLAAKAEMHLFGASRND